MKKLFLSLTLLAGLGLTASAQTNPVKFGIKAGATFSNMSFSGQGISLTGSSNTSFFIGGTADIPVGEIFSVQPGLSFIGKGTKQKGAGTTVINGTSTSVIYDDKINPLYLEIPVNLLANFKAGEGKFFVGAGPYYAFGVAGKEKGSYSVATSSLSNSQSIDRNIKYGDKDDADLKRGDFGLNFLAGYQLKNGLSLQAGYGLGLSNVMNNDGQDFTGKNRVFSVGLGYSF